MIVPYHWRCPTHYHLKSSIAHDQIMDFNNDFWGTGLSRTIRTFSVTCNTSENFEITYKSNHLFHHNIYHAFLLIFWGYLPVKMSRCFNSRSLLSILKKFLELHDVIERQSQSIHSIWLKICVNSSKECY